METESGPFRPALTTIDCMYEMADRPRTARAAPIKRCVYGGEAVPYSAAAPAEIDSERETVLECSI